ncbi:Uric acid degradation bifunctional protein TTL [Porphyridium purpureum]|uniref:2-oxo-4-hydroxy-4-carboxy-5-ureidoimidazoline decarboxylase n=1 Tax=Porphyridium purpureum TaxID=35688 RepID=A0A5J4YQ15_PORPP|nr:Uric acid degradation bifunctional protein TTL [Porphyridium purpureum]|eukprot:POR1122..scf295_9
MAEAADSKDPFRLHRGITVLDNVLPENEVRDALLSCCRCTAWANTLAEGRPFLSADQLFECAQLQWQKASEADVLEAIKAHPRIGERKGESNKHADKLSQSWSEGEQATVLETQDIQLVRELQLKNDEYFAKFGFVFLICASGKSPAYMTEQLTTRLRNSKQRELEIAKAEQEAIMLLPLVGVGVLVFALLFPVALIMQDAWLPNLLDRFPIVPRHHVALHALAFFFIGILIEFALRFWFSGKPSARVYARCVAFGYASSTEILQALLSEQHAFGFEDVLGNVGGLLCAWLVFRLGLQINGAMAASIRRSQDEEANVNT